MFWSLPAIGRDCKLAACCVQNELFRAEVDSLQLKLQLSLEEQHSLEEWRASGDHLRHHSEFIAGNINGQKYVICNIC